MTCKGEFAACVYPSEAPSPPRFLFGVVKQFCRFGIWSNTQCLTPVYALHTTRSPPPLHTVHTPVLIHIRKGGGWTSEKVRWALVHKRGRKYQHDWLYLQSIIEVCIRFWYVLHTAIVELKTHRTILLSDYFTVSGWSIWETGGGGREMENVRKWFRNRSDRCPFSSNVDVRHWISFSRMVRAPDY
jgi:hypothetical protein